jgi:YVTN family beta-propeller protein
MTPSDPVLMHRVTACDPVTPSFRARARRPVVHALFYVGCAVLTSCSKPELGPRAIVSNENDGTISVIDLRTRERTSTLAVGKRPRGLAVSRDHKTLYVALSGSPKAGPGVDEDTLPPPDRRADGIGVVDLEELTLTRVIPSGQDPESFSLVGDDLLVVSNEETSEASIVDVGARTIRARVPVGSEPEGVATSPDGVVWITSEGDSAVTAIDPVHGTAIAKVSTGQRPRAIAFTPDGALGFVTSENDASVTVLDARARRAVGRIEIPREGSAPIGPRPMGIVVSREGARAFVSTGRGGSVAVIDVASRAVSRVISDVGARPWGIAVTPDGLVVTANGSSDDISILDPEAGRVLHRIPAGGSPWGVVVVP